MNKRSNQLLKSMFVLAFGTLLPKIASFFTLPILTAHLSKTEYGTLDTISTMASLFLPFATMQIHVAVFRYLIDLRSDIKRSEEIISTFMFFEIPLSLIATVVLYLVLFRLSPFIRLGICMFYLSEVWFSSLQQLARGFGNNKLYSTGTIIQSLILLVLVYLSINLTARGLVAALYCFAVSYFLSALYMFFMMNLVNKIHRDMIDKALLKEMLQYAWPMIPESLSFWVLSFSDRALITTILGVEFTAIYAVATKIPSLLSLFRNVFSFAWQENASLAHDDNNANQYYSSVFNSFVSLLSGGTVLLMVIYPLLYKLLIRGDYSDSLPHIPILLIANFFSMIASYLAGIYIAKKKTRSIGITTVIAAIINIIIDLLLMKLIGVFAASISTLVGYLFLSLFRMIDVKKIQPIRYNLKHLVICFSFLFIIMFLCFINNYIVKVIIFFIGVIYAVVVNKKIICSSIHTVFHRLQNR